jgi:hypothetical protein
MADLKFGNVTPAVGNIKLGSSNVSEIYQGATKLWPLGSAPQPGEVTVCDLIWTKTNSTITATTSGSAIPVVTNQNDWITKCQNNDPAACYWQFDSNNAFRGLYYNVFATEVIQPPTGFRVPTAQDWQDLIGCAATGSPDSPNDVTSLGNNYYGFWSSNIASNSRFGTVDFNSISAGYTYQNSTTIPPALPQSWVSQGKRDIYHQQQPGSLPASYYPITMFWRGPQGANQDWIVGYWNAGFADGFQGGKNGGALMRFVKDAPPPATVNFYFNDTQTGTPTTSLYQDAFAAGNTQGTNVALLQTNASFEIIGNPATIKFVAYTDVGTAEPPLARFTNIDWKIYTNLNRTILAHQTEWEFATRGSDSFPIIPTTPSSTLGFSIENWGTEAGSVTLNPGVYYIRLVYYYGNSNISGGFASSNYKVSFEQGP